MESLLVRKSNLLGSSQLSLLQGAGVDTAVHCTNAVCLDLGGDVSLAGEGC